jgi:hypothetical protein
VNDRIKLIQYGFRQAHDVEATHIESVPVREKFQGETVWKGIVDVFDIKGHPQANRGYGWEYEENGEKQTATVLGVYPVDSPLAAVRAFIVDQTGKSHD